MVRSNKEEVEKIFSSNAAYLGQGQVGEKREMERLKKKGRKKENKKKFFIQCDWAIIFYFIATQHAECKILSYSPIFYSSHPNPPFKTPTAPSLVSHRAFSFQNKDGQRRSDFEKTMPLEIVFHQYLPDRLYQAFLAHYSGQNIHEGRE